jgi:predicted DNA-binding WGR domain protein
MRSEKAIGIRLDIYKRCRDGHFMAKQCFEFNNPSINANKFWNVNIQGDSVEFKWGRIGTAGQSIEKEFSSVVEARTAAFKKINEKTREGYKQVPC